MATKTYTLIQEQVLSGSAASVTFSSIPQIYEDLVLEITCTNASTSDVYVKANGSSSGYSYTYFSGSGSAASSGRVTSATYWRITFNSAPTTSVGYTSTLQIMSYSSPNVYKTALVRSNNASTGTDAFVELWQSTSAVTSIALTASSDFASGSTFRLYGLVG